jgi:hypothetical protein
MRKVEEYRNNAAECRQLAARSSNNESRSQLIQMAETWEALAKDRGEQIERQKRIAAFETHGDGNVS